MDREGAREACKRSTNNDKTHRSIRNNMGKMSLIKSRNDVVAIQLHIYNINKSSFVAAMGEEAYDNKIIELLNKLPDPSAVSIGRENADEDGDDESSSLK